MQSPEDEGMLSPSPSPEDEGLLNQIPPEGHGLLSRSPDDQGMLSSPDDHDADSPPEPHQQLQGRSASLSGGAAASSYDAPAGSSRTPAAAARSSVASRSPKPPTEASADTDPAIMSSVKTYADIDDTLIPTRWMENRLGVKEAGGEGRVGLATVVSGEKLGECGEKLITGFATISAAVSAADAR